jgi:DNA-binding FrmR family transcriptional regulator
MMDKKVKKKIDTLNLRLQTLRRQLAGAKQQMDDPQELKHIQDQVAAAEAELARLKGP